MSPRGAPAAPEVPAGSAFAPPLWLRNPHLQTALATSGVRRRRAAQALAATGAVTTSHIIDAGDGVRLQGLHSELPGRRPRGLALLLHGWEGSAESSYMQLTAAQLLGAGFDVFRLNFRDHGDTHHLNEEIFHSCRIDEVVAAACVVSARFARGPMTVAGYSLGGNFALRVALRAPGAGLALAGVAAVCPLLDPARTMTRMETGLPVYLRYFERKWRGSLQRKRSLFPARIDLDDATLGLGMRELTDWLVRRYTPFDSLEGYFDGYCIARERLSALAVPAHILTAADDPVIPLEDFHALALPASAHLEIARWGGHCGFLEGAHMRGYAERWVAGRLCGALAAG